MKVFMSWSGARSKATAELLHGWVKCVIQAAKPWISTRGIGRGAVWFTEINKELQDTPVGIICLTHENKNSPWILFEAGALAKGVTTTRVCTFLVDLQPNDVHDPLAQFNHTLPNKNGLFSLVETLNSSLEHQLDDGVLRSVFEIFWPEFETKFAALLAQFPQEGVVEVRTERSILEEILLTTRNLDKNQARSIDHFYPNNLLSLTQLSHTNTRTRSQVGAVVLRNEILKGAKLEDLLLKAQELNVPEEIARIVWDQAQSPTAEEIFGGGASPLPKGGMLG